MPSGGRGRSRTTVAGGAQQIAGEAELDRKLLEVENALTGPVLLAATKEGAKVIAQAGALRAPVLTDAATIAAHPDWPPGLLKRSFRTETVLSKKRTAVVDAGPKKEAFYAPFVELGEGNGPPHPYFRPAFDESWEQAASAIRIALRTALFEKAGV